MFSTRSTAGQSQGLWSSPLWLLAIILGGISLIAGCERTPLLRPRREVSFGAIRNHYHFDWYHVRSGQTLSSLSREFGIPLGVLAYVNGLNPSDQIDGGRRLKVPFWEELFKGKSRRSGMPQLMWPVLGGVITSPYGYRWRRFHGGIDIRASHGEPFFASHGGRIAYAGPKGDYGNLVILSSGAVTTYYAHASRIHVRTGDRVSQGDILGFVGTTGNATGPHCHFETRLRNVNGIFKPVNPIGFFPRAESVSR